MELSARLCITVGLSVLLEARVGFWARPAGAGVNCPAAVTVNSPVSFYGHSGRGNDSGQW